MTIPAVAVAIQARMGSTRLPGKVALPFGDRPMLAFQLARLAAIGDRLAARGAQLSGLVVATSDRPRDDAIAALAADAGAEIHRGLEDDVLGRVATVLDHHPADHLVRLTADCPWTDPGLVADIVAAHLRAGADYTSNTLLRSWPDGLDVEVISRGALQEAAGLAPAGPEREHVTPFLQRHPERFALAQVHQDRALGDLRWTVDTREDLDALQPTAGRPGAVAATWDALLAWLPRTAHRPGPLRLRPMPEDGGALAAPARQALDEARTSWSSHHLDVVETPGLHVWVAPAGATFERAWLVERTDEDGDPIGWAAVSVSAGGEGELDGWWPAEAHDDVLDVVRGALQADAQVASLRLPARPTEQTGSR